MKFFQNGNRGFSLIEIMIALALSAVVVVGGYKVFTSTVGNEKATIVQALADSEFSAGLQLGQNAVRIAPFVGLSSMGNCLHSNSGTGCTAFAVWNDFPSTTGPHKPVFQTKLDLQGPCQPPKPCLVQRTMRYRWVCTASSCTSLQVEVKVVSNDQDKVKTRSTQITIDRRSFSDRGQIQFSCDSGGESVMGVNIDTLSDICANQAGSTCIMPSAFFVVGEGPTDCKPVLASSCGTGYSSIGLDVGSELCAP